MVRFIKWIGGRKFLSFIITIIAIILFPKVASYLLGALGIYCGGNGIVSLAWKK